jgi:hypothetical protein
MSVEDRRLYHEALESVFPASIAESVSETWKITRSVADRRRPRPLWICLSLAARLLRLNAERASISGHESRVKH